MDPAGFITRYNLLDLLPLTFGSTNELYFIETKFHTAVHWVRSF